MLGLKTRIVKWVEGRIYGRWPKTSLPAWRSNPPNSIPYPKCWCGHYARSHNNYERTMPGVSKTGCAVVDCPCEKLMDSTVVVCTKCLQLHPADDDCKIPNTPMPQVIDGISQGVLVNFKPAKDK